MVESNLYRPAVLEAPSYWSYLGIPESGAELVQSVRQLLHFVHIQEMKPARSCLPRLRYSSFQRLDRLMLAWA